MSHSPRCVSGGLGDALVELGSWAAASSVSSQEHPQLGNPSTSCRTAGVSPGLESRRSGRCHWWACQHWASKLQLFGLQKARTLRLVWPLSIWPEGAPKARRAGQELCRGPRRLGSVSGPGCDWAAPRMSMPCPPHLIKPTTPLTWSLPHPGVA